MSSKKEIKEISLEDIRINSKERAINKTRYEQFCKYCWWLLIRDTEGEDIFYANELARFAKVSYTTAYRFFIDLVNLGYAIQERAGTITFFKLVKNDGHTKLKELIPYLKKTLKRYCKKK